MSVYVNRKVAYASLVNRKYLKIHVPDITNLFRSENVCPKYRAIFDACMVRLVIIIIPLFILSDVYINHKIS